MYLPLEYNITLTSTSNISCLARSRISPTLVLICLDIIFWPCYIEIWRRGNFSLSSILRGVVNIFVVSCDYYDILYSDTIIFKVLNSFSPNTRISASFHLPNWVHTPDFTPAPAGSRHTVHSCSTKVLKKLWKYVITRTNTFTLQPWF